MDTSNLSVSQLSYLYQHGDASLKSLATARLSAMQLAQQAAMSRTPSNTSKIAPKKELED